MRFIHNSKVINTKEDCKDYHLKPGDYFFNALHLDEDGQKVYMAIEELVVNHEGQTYDGFWRVEGPEGPEFCHILFMNRFVDEDVHNSYAIPGIVDSVNWELENLK